VKEGLHTEVGQLLAKPLTIRIQSLATRHFITNRYYLGSHQSLSMSDFFNSRSWSVTQFESFPSRAAMNSRVAFGVLGNASARANSCLAVSSSLAKRPQAETWVNRLMMNAISIQRKDFLFAEARYSR